MLEWAEVAGLVSRVPDPRTPCSGRKSEAGQPRRYIPAFFVGKQGHFVLGFPAARADIG